MRIGIGYDVHRLVAGRPLVLGGIRIPHRMGLQGHSDADVLVHAVCDALLGAAGEGDIGLHYPDSDPSYQNIYSIRLLERTALKIKAKGLRIVNLDAVVFAEAPKLSAHRADMQRCIAGAAGILPEQVNIKATTTEGLGPIGRGEGIAAMCSALLENSDE
jgi:2-C-methyl-D-erythritol 2,4-cyclodiphosphate synthase